MVIVFLISGFLFGAVAAGFTLMSGGSILFAIAAYSGFGTLGALLSIGGILMINGAYKSRDEWSDENPAQGPISA